MLLETATLSFHSESVANRTNLLSSVIKIALESEIHA